jgi:hypothetical protein
MTSYQRIIKSIWEIKDQEGCKVTEVGEISEVGKYFSSSLFKEPVGCPIIDILKVINLFPNSILDEMNVSLQVWISKTEIFSTLSSFQKFKILGPNGLTVEFYLGFMSFSNGIY